MNGNEKNGVILQERDRRVLSALKTLRFLDRDQMMAIGGFDSITRVNARAKQLAEADVLEALPVGTIAGGRKLVYTLSRHGAHLVGAPYRPLRRSHTPALSGDPFLEHQLEINKVYVTVKHRPIPVLGVTFRRWLSFSTGLLENLPLIPDAYFEMNGPGGAWCCFLEVDLGTESPKVWLNKIRLYLQLAVSGEFQEQFQQSRFRILVITSTERRLETIRKAVRRSTDKIFWLSTFETLSGDGFWSPVWQRPTGNQTYRLI